MQKTELNVNNLWKCFFRASSRVSFSYFPNTALNNTNFCGSCYNI